MHEQWLPVVGYEDTYQVSDRGRVRRIRGGQGAVAGKILAACPNDKNYRHVLFYQDGKRKDMAVHILVMTAFVGPVPEGMEVNHKDGNKPNNDLSNLEYVTKSGNLRHAVATLGKISRLTTDEVIKIKRLLAEGVKGRRIAKMFGVAESTICMIKKGKHWSYV